MDQVRIPGNAGRIFASGRTILAGRLDHGRGMLRRMPFTACKMLARRRVLRAMMQGLVSTPTLEQPAVSHSSLTRTPSITDARDLRGDISFWANRHARAK